MNHQIKITISSNHHTPILTDIATELVLSVEDRRRAAEPHRKRLLLDGL